MYCGKLGLASLLLNASLPTLHFGCATEEICLLVTYNVQQAKDLLLELANTALP